MNVITDTLRQIVRRKLWPVAVVLIGAAAAVPFVLAKEPETAPVAANPVKTESIPATFVAATKATDETERRRVLGGPKDPFEPTQLPKSKKTKKAKASADETPTDTPKTDDTSKAAGGSSGPTTTTAPPVSPEPTATPTQTIPAYSIKVRFGTTDATTDPEAKTVERLSVLPDEESPVLVYRGVEDGGKVAIFELTGVVEAQGDGECAPKPEDCQYLKLRAGETEFITVSDTGDEATDAQYQLDLVKIYKKATKEKVTDPTAQPLTKASSASLKSKGAQLRRRNRYVFDSTTGTLHLARGKKTPAASL
jgi:hypothetical protein